MRKFLQAMPAAVFIAFVTVVTGPLFAQTPPAKASCLNEDDVKKMQVQLQTAQGVALDEKLSDELLALKEEDIKQTQTDFDKTRKKNSATESVLNVREKIEARLCTLLKEKGWFTIGLTGKEGAAAAMHLLKSAASFEMRLALLPVIAEAVRKNEIEKNEAYASFIDRLRLQGGMKQLFGTQAIVSDDFLVLEPIEDEANVDARRKLYGMAPLVSYMKYLEKYHRAPLIKSPVLRGDIKASPAKNAFSKNIVPELIGSETPFEDEVISIDTNLVSLDVSVRGGNMKNPPGIFEQDDFRLFEDGKEEKVTFFSKTDVPFDLVLLLDLSASTYKKVDLIRKSTERFINSARPVDRLAIVTFASEVDVVSPLTTDRVKLLESAKNIKNTGFSRVWDALQFSLEEVLGPKTPDRRRAVVFMTDGVESSLMYYSHMGSKITFAELLDTVRGAEAAVIPIYLDTENADSSSPKTREIARATLAKLADESGGLYYKAKKLEDLVDVYERVLNDLSKVYSIGYIPSNEMRNGQWRTVKIEIPSRPDLKIHTKAGYYAN
jgi:Ca-activated chloride channel family protein